MAIASVENESVYLRQSNALTTAAYVLSRNEKRLVYLALAQLANGEIKEERGRYDVTIHHSAYAQYFDESYKNVSRDISKASAALQKREVIFYKPKEDGDDGEKALDALSWTTKRSVKPRRGLTILSFNAELVDLIKEDKQYTGYFFMYVAKLDNYFAMRLYESIRLWLTIKRKYSHVDGKKQTQSVNFSIDWLIERYGIPKSYRRMSDFRRKFLNPAINEINEKTDIELSYVENSTNEVRKNKTTSITITWALKNKHVIAMSNEECDQILTPPDKNRLDESVFVEMGLVYINTFSKESTPPSFDWVMDYLLVYQRVHADRPLGKLKSKLLEIAA